MTEKEKLRKEEQKKTNRANEIGKHSKRVKDFYESLKKIFQWAFRWVSYFIDHVFFNVKYAKFVSLALAILTYAIVNYNSLSSLYSATIKTARDKANVEVVAEYNVDEYEVTGLPDTVNVTIIGDATSVASSYNSDGAVVANLEDYTEGTFDVTLTTQNFGNNVTVKIEPSTISVTLKKKMTKKFTVSYDFVNKDNMDSIYTLGTPTFDVEKITVRAAQDTLDNIAFVRALIDVSDVSEDFEQDAALVAYDTNGQVIDADLNPSTVHVKVPVSSASKSVPIEAIVVGDVPNGQAIETVHLSQDNIVIYGSETALAKVDSISAILDGTLISANGDVEATLELPDGVTCPNLSKVIATVTLGESASKEIQGIKISLKNDKTFTATSAEDNDTVTVTVVGTSANIDKVTAEDIEVYVNLKNVKAGTQTLELYVTQPTNGFVKYILDKASLSMNVVEK